MFGMETGWVGALDGQGAADALVAAHADLVTAEVVELKLAARWADLHSADSLPARASGCVLPGTECAKLLGEDGTPLVAEFAAAELGALTARGAIAAATLIADSLDVRHRLPVMWSALDTGRPRVWQARKIASRTRSVGLSLEQARWVDSEVTPFVGMLSWAEVLDLLEAKIVEVDPRAAEERERAEALRRFVATGQCNEYGLKTFVAKADAGDVIFIVAMCDRIAQILLLRATRTRLTYAARRRSGSWRIRHARLPCWPSTPGRRASPPTLLQGPTLRPVRRTTRRERSTCRRPRGLADGPASGRGRLRRRGGGSGSVSCLRR